MKDNLVKLNFHGKWDIPINWELNVNSLGEAIRAVEANTKKLYKELLEKDKKNIRYCVVINGNNFNIDKNTDEMTINEIKSCELCVVNNNLKTIDIIPVYEGADSKSLGAFSAILGVVLIVIGVILLESGVGAALIVAGIGLLSAGVYALLSKPPSFEDFREIEQGGRTSYLFNGPVNIVGEGGPVPVGYGRLVIGSQVISAAFTVTDFDVDDTSVVVRNIYDDIDFIEFPPEIPADYGVTYDSDALDFIERAGIAGYSVPAKLAVNNLVLALKETVDGATLWSKILAFYPFVGGTSSSHAQNLKSSSFTITWYGNEHHTSIGIHGNGPTELVAAAQAFYGDTGLNPSSEGLDDDNHLYVYNRTSVLGGANHVYLIAGNDATNRLSIAKLQPSPTLYIGMFGNSNATSPFIYTWGGSSQKGHSMFGRLDSSTVYAGGLTTAFAAPSTRGDYVTASDTSVAAPNVNLYILSRNNNGTAFTFSDANLAAASIGYSMSRLQMLAYFEAIQTFQTALGRQV